ncbi:MAG: hypothetical protein WBZ37_05875 [Mycobacterium sp.]
MDYAFSPGTQAYYANSRKLLALRPNTKVVDAAGLTTIADFLTYLNSTAGLTLPAGDLFIVSHGNDRAWMQIHIDKTQHGGAGGPDPGTFYEVVEAAVPGASDPLSTGVTAGSIVIPKKVNTDSTGTLTVMKVNFRGCRIGTAQPFVDKFKTAFGGQSGLTAPKHFHKLYEFDNTGMMEYLAYSFEFVNKTAMANKVAVVAAFTAANLTFNDGTPVPAANWTDWVSDDVSPGEHFVKNVYVNLGMQIGTLKQVQLDIQFRHTPTRPWTYTIDPLTPMPPKAQYLDTLRAVLKTDPMYASTHPFPVYQRFALNSVDDFVDQLTWNFTPGTNSLKCTGVQHVYTVLVPITDGHDPGKDNLIFNFYPVSGGTDPVTTNLSTSNGMLFYNTP